MLNKNTIAWLLPALLALPACGNGGSGDTGGSGGSAGPSVAVEASKLHFLKDSTPSPTADRIYFVAGDTGATTLYAVAQPSNDTPSALASGFGDAEGVVVASDGSIVYVADAAAANHGGIFAIPAAGGAPTEVMGTEGYAPTALDLVAEGGADTLYFVGVDPGDNQPGVFKLPASGGTATVVAKGFPAPGLSGVASAQGTVFVSGPGVDGKGALYAITGATPKPVLSDIDLGTPAGIALTLDGSTLLVSSLDAKAGTSQVILFDVAKGTTSIFNDVINANHGSGGVHRAHGVDVFSWAGLTAGTAGQGIVYRISLN